MTIREKPYCHILTASAFADESQLQNGLWLVGLFASWSATDLMARGYVQHVVQQFEGKLRFGILMFEADEVQDWHPEVRVMYATPVWVMFKHGQLIGKSVGSPERENWMEWLRSQLQS